MTTMLVRHADWLVTIDSNKRRMAGGGLFVRNGVIEQVGPTDTLPAEADQVIDATGLIVLPGLVNTHHHLYQTLTRAVPAVQDVGLFDWLKTLYPIWARMDDEAVYVSAKVGLIELLLSGCTTVSDHLYLFPRNATLDAEIQAARELGVRFQPCRGSMSLGRSRGGLPPDSIVQSEGEILRDCERVVDAYHDPARYSMCRITIAPCSPFSVTVEAMRASAVWARERGLTLHTHLAETLDEERFCIERFGKRPLALIEDLDWLGPEVWLAHCVHLNAGEIERMAETGTGVAHCPSSNMRLGSGIAPIREMRDAGVRVGLAVDGSASNDSSHMLAEVRQAMLLQRVVKGAAAMSAAEALEMATVGGAQVLGRDDLGVLAPGMAADFVGWRLDALDYAGAQRDPLGALVFCTPRTADLSVINGRLVVWRGEVLGVDVPRLVAWHKKINRRIVY